MTGFPGTFQAGLTTGYLAIGAVQKQPASASLGFPGVFPASLTTGYVCVGAVQRDVASVGPETTPTTPRRTIYW